MANAAGMLVWTLDDMWAFVSMLLAEGRHDGQRLLSPAPVAAMTRDHLTADQRASARLFLGEHGGSGVLHGRTRSDHRRATRPVGIRLGRGHERHVVQRFDAGISGILRPQRAMTSPEPPQLFADFWEVAYRAMGG